MVLNKIPVLETSRLILRPLNESDVVDIKNNITNSLVEFLPTIPFPYKISDAKNFLKYVKKSSTELVWGIEYNSRIIGTITIIKEDFDKVRISYLLNEAYQRKGIMFEAVLNIIDHCFTVIKVNKIYTGVISSNLPSLKLLEKAGFMKDGVHREHILNKGVYVDEIIYSLLRKDYLKNIMI